MDVSYSMDVLRTLGRSWSMPIIQELKCDPHSELGFMELKRRLEDISSKVLSERLKQLARQNLVERREYKKTQPKRVNYTLTEKGYKVSRLVDELKD